MLVPKQHITQLKWMKFIHTNTTMVKTIKHIHHHNEISNHAWLRELHVQKYLRGFIKITEANLWDWEARHLMIENSHYFSRPLIIQVFHSRHGLPRLSLPPIHTLKCLNSTLFSISFFIKKTSHKKSMNH